MSASEPRLGGARNWDGLRDATAGCVREGVARARCLTLCSEPGVCSEPHSLNPQEWMDRYGSRGGGTERPSAGMVSRRRW